LYSAISRALNEYLIGDSHWIHEINGVIVASITNKPPKRIHGSVISDDMADADYIFSQEEEMTIPSAVATYEHIIKVIHMYINVPKESLNPIPQYITSW